MSNEEVSAGNMVPAGGGSSSLRKWLPIKSWS